jgi:hypothetical protein
VDGDDPDVDSLDPPRADRLDLALLQRPQELGLDRQRQLADLVEHQRAAVGLGEEAAARADRAGERAADVTEQLGLGQVGRQRRAVEPHQRPAARRPTARAGADATNSLPVPVSPRTSTVTSRLATRAVASSSRRIGRLSPTMRRPSARSAAR